MSSSVSNLSSDQIFQVLVKSIRKVKPLFEQVSPKSLTVETKDHYRDFVTQVDIDCQSILKTTITKLMVDEGVDRDQVAFIGEEEGLAGQGKYVFVIDPIDGTTNFIAGLDYFAVSVGLFVNEKQSFGLVYHPPTQILYWAAKGQGAYQGKLLAVDNDLVESKTKLQVVPKFFRDSLLVFSLHSQFELSDQELLFSRAIRPSIGGLRIMGASVLDMVHVASNTLQLSTIFKSGIWDVSASSLIAQEAGCWVGDFAGQELDFRLDQPRKVYKVATCHPDNKDQLLKYLADFAS